MLIVLDERQTSKTRLLILNEVPDLNSERFAFINNKLYPFMTVHGLQKSIAIRCEENEPSLIGKAVKFIDMTV